ncbi:MAG: S8 family serine peptidase [Akkermansiaceae bacterium]|nr:S8 family serine peptidase [Akkermansiaceae bacterium]
MNAPRIALLGSLILSFLALLFASSEDEYVAGEALVTFKPNVPSITATTTLNKNSIELAETYDKISMHQQRVVGLVRNRQMTTPQLIQTLKADPNVETAEPNYIRHVFAPPPNDTDFSKLWGLLNTGQGVNGTTGTSGADINFIPAWKRSRQTTNGVVVGIVDTGIDLTHPDLTANIWVNPGEIPGNGIDDDGDGYIDDVNGYNFANGNGSVTDSGYHGTHVAGTAGAIGKNHAGVIGVNDHAKILPLKVSSDGNSMTTSAIIAAYNYAITLKQRGVNIVALNASFGGGSPTTADQNAIAALASAGIVLCAAAGNSATNNDSAPFYPASYPATNIISVAAFDQNYGLSSFSNYGLTTVDLAAPGTNIYSTEPLSMVTARISSITVGTSNYQTKPLTYSGTTPATGLTANIRSCGLGNPADFPSNVRGNIALIQRGTLDFSVKVTNAMNAGAIAAIIYDNTGNSLDAVTWTLSTAGAWIPSMQVTQADGASLLTKLSFSGNVLSTPDPTLAYQFLNGTSMATPHVTAAVAFAAMNFPTDSLSQRIARILTHTTPTPSLSGKMTTGGRLNLLGIVDTDNDGLPDWWEIDYFGNLTKTGTQDSDGDRFNNLAEFLSGTSPTNPSSYLAITESFRGTGAAANHFTIGFPSVQDTSYQILWSADLMNWSTLGTTILGTGSLIEVVDQNALSTASKRFYRLYPIPE